MHNAHKSHQPARKHETIFLKNHPNALAAVQSYFPFFPLILYKRAKFIQISSSEVTQEKLSSFWEDLCIGPEAWSLLLI